MADEFAGQEPSKSCRLLVAAIDIGSQYSGYAYSFKSNWPLIITNKWSGGEQVSYKAPSALLLNPDESFNSFGFDAEHNYASLIAEEDEECQEYFFFSGFKIIFTATQQKRIHRKTQCLTEDGRSVDALKVFTNCINFMKDHLLKEVQARMLEGISMEDIDFVLTVPAICNDTARMFLREAAEKAGIKGDHLHVALEPEAALTYCQLMHVESGVNCRIFCDAKYMVIDLGGETVNFTVHKLQVDGTFAEVMPASGGPWGGKCVDRAFHDFLVELFSEDVIRRFRTDPECVEDNYDFWRQFEIKKRYFVKVGERFCIRFPLVLVNLVRRRSNKSVQEFLENSKFRENLIFKQGKLWMDYSFWKQLIDPIVKKITDHLENISSTIGEDLEAILMIGGFSECDVVQEAVKNFFQDKCRVVIPHEASLAVLKGAVCLGHQPNLISERITSYTYGIQIWPQFDPTVHPQSKLVRMGNEKRCRGVFLRFVAKGEKIKLRSKKSFILKALQTRKMVMEIDIFISSEEDPQFVDEESCVKLGILEVPLQSVVEDENSEIEISFIFGHTEIQVSARNFQTNIEYMVTLDLLSPNIQFPQN